MVTVRLFAGLREAAGVDRADIEGETVGDVLDAASQRYGAAFVARLSRARVWLNGDEADPADLVSEGDEVALIPPVSGGAGSSSLAFPGWVAAMVAALVLIAANSLGGSAWWAAAVVGVVGAWAIDVGSASAERGRDIPLIPILLSAFAGAAAGHAMGGPGFALAMLVAVVATLGWGVASDNSRLLSVLAPAAVASVVAASATAGLVLTRMSFTPGTRTAGVFLAVILAATSIAAATEGAVRLPFGDPFSATVVVAVVVAVVMAAVWDLDMVVFLIAGLVLAAGLVAGRGLGAMLRTREVILLETGPGMLSALDGAVLAAALYYPILLLVG
ncbi:MAG: MoaD/ThiS family protein [Acidimicrobiia bacterium]|nr:MoaD/ThiS family protein [Acidimicrobiia bacterium]